MKKILVLVEKLNYSGASKIATWLVDRLSMDGYDVTIMSRLGDSGFYQLSGAVRKVYLKMETKKSILGLFFCVSQIRKILKNELFDIVISFLPMEGALAIISSIGSSIPIIVSERSDPYWENGIRPWVCRFLFRFADGAVFQTNQALKYYPKALQKRSCVIANPVFKILGETVDYDVRRNVITYSGRLFIKQKRQDVLLKAFSLICQEEKNILLEIFGDGPDREKLEDLAERLGISEHVRFYGKTIDVLRYISTSKVFLFSSDYEGIPNSVMEAMSVGTPVVSTDSSPGGVRALIQHGRNGYIVPRGDYNALAKYTLLLLRNKELSMKISYESKKIIEVFSEDMIYNMWISYIKSIYKNSKEDRCENYTS